MFGKADPYVLVQLGDQRIKSKTVKKNREIAKNCQNKPKLPLRSETAKIQIGISRQI